MSDHSTGRMPKVPLALVLVAAWLIASMVNFGALNAHTRKGRCSPWIEEEQPVDLAFSFMPVAGTFMAIFETDLVSSGFSWKWCREGEEGPDGR